MLIINFCVFLLSTMNQTYMDMVLIWIARSLSKQRQSRTGLFLLSMLLMQKKFSLEFAYWNANCQFNSPSIIQTESGTKYTSHNSYPKLFKVEGQYVQMIINPHHIYTYDNNSVAELECHRWELFLRYGGQ